MEAATRRRWRYPQEDLGNEENADSLRLSGWVRQDTGHQRCGSHFCVVLVISSPESGEARMGEAKTSCW